MSPVEEVRARIPRIASRWFLGEHAFGASWYRVDYLGNPIATGLEELSEVHQEHVRAFLVDPQLVAQVNRYLTQYRLSTPVVFVHNGCLSWLGFAFGATPDAAKAAADAALRADGWTLLEEEG